MRIKETKFDIDMPLIESRVTLWASPQSEGGDDIGLPPEVGVVSGGAHPSGFLFLNSEYIFDDYPDVIDTVSHEASHMTKHVLEQINMYPDHQCPCCDELYARMVGYLTGCIMRKIEVTD